MIQNSKQYVIATKALRKLQQKRRFLERRIRFAPKRRQDELEFEEVVSAILELEDQLNYYNALMAGTIELNFDNIQETGRLLVSGRISSGYSQAGFAERIGINRQLLCVYEKTLYESTSLKQIRRIAKEVELAIAERQSEERMRRDNRAVSRSSTQSIEHTRNAPYPTEQHH